MEVSNEEGTRRTSTASDRPHGIVCDKSGVRIEEILLRGREVHDVERERNEGEERRGEYRRQSLDLKGQTWNGEQTSLDLKRAENVHNNPEPFL